MNENRNEKPKVDPLDNIPYIPKGLWGVPKMGPCKLCGGTITAVRSTYNGHLLIKCDTCNFMLME